MSVVVAELAAKLGLKVDKKSWSVGNDVIAGLGKALAVFAGYKVVQGIAGMAKEVIDLGGHLNDTSQQVGVSVEALQELGYAAEQNGSSMDEVVAAMKRFAGGMQEARKTGKGPFADAMRSVGVSMRDLKGETLDQNLEVIAERFAKMPDGAKKTALAIDLFGKSGASLIPTLNKGQKGVAELRNEAHKLGRVMSEKDVAALDDLGDDTDRLGSAWQGLKQTIVIALIPALSKLVGGLKDWIIANREVLASKVVSFISALAEVLIILGKAIAFVVEHWEIFAALLAGGALVTGVIRLIKLVEWLKTASVQAAIKSLAAWALAALPFVLIALAIAGIILLFTKYRKQTLAVLRAIVNAVGDFFKWIGRGFVRLGEIFAGWGRSILDAFSMVWEKIKQGAKDTWEWIKALPGRVAEAFIGSATDVGAAQAYLQQQAAAKARGAGAPGVPFVPTAPGRPAGTLTPAAANAGSVMFTGDMNVTVPPGANAEEYRTAVKQGIDEWWAGERRQSYAGTGAP